VLEIIKEERNNLHELKRRKANRTVHILRRNCLVKYVVEGRRDGRTRKKT
jgi:hypothetical protein